MSTQGLSVRGVPWTACRLFTCSPRLRHCSCPVSVLLRGVHAYVQTLPDKTLYNVWYDVDCVSCHATILVLQRVRAQHQVCIANLLVHELRYIDT
jgi:hypothetical protein